MQKLRTQITYCDPATRRIEGLIKGGAIVQIVAWETAATFRWPQEREIWTIRYSNGYWHLGQKIDYDTEPDVTTPLDKLAPGDTRVATGGRIVLDGDVQVYGTLSASNFTGATGGSSANFTYSSGPPSGPSVGDLWMDSDTGKLFVFLSDGNSTLWLEP